MNTRTSTWIPAATLAAALMSVAACSGNQNKTPPADQASQAGQTQLTATLTGAAEAPTPGETSGTGSATVTLKPAEGQVCYTLTATNLDSVVGAHIHKGAVGVAGPVAIMLKAPTGGSVTACAQADSSTIQDMMANPADYYVNVHDAKFPKGAIRGQLQKATSGM